MSARCNGVRTRSSGTVPYSSSWAPASRRKKESVTPRASTAARTTPTNLPAESTAGASSWVVPMTRIPPMANRTQSLPRSTPSSSASGRYMARASSTLASTRIGLPSRCGIATFAARASSITLPEDRNACAL